MVPERANPCLCTLRGTTRSPRGGHMPRPLARTVPPVQRLVQLGHRRIVSLSNRGRNGDGPRYTQRLFLNELEAQGLEWSSYNLPSWDNGKNGFRRCLESLFRHTPPTALIIEEAPYFFATLQFCGDRNLRVPEDVSIISEEHAASFDFANPSVAHSEWDYRPMVRRIVLWADNIARGKEDKRQTRIKVRFVRRRDDRPGTRGKVSPDCVSGASLGSVRAL